VPDPAQEPIYRLIDSDLLGRLMRYPNKGGTRHTVRSLADATGISKSKISNMLNGRQTKLPESKATATAVAVGVNRKALFTPIVFTFTNLNTSEERTK
jgi:transcriptional regulator with XRE-family HTH domain